MSKKPDGLNNVAPRRVHRELHPDYGYNRLSTRLARAEHKQRVEIDKMLDRTIAAGKARAAARHMKKSDNSGYRLTQFSHVIMPVQHAMQAGIAVRDFKMARRAAATQQARLEGRNLHKVRAR